MLIIIILLLVAIAVPLIYVCRKSLTKSFYVMQSKTLPYISDTFVGRNEELFNISRLLDFEQTRTRVVSITGPPGFGKSTLAIKVGHNFAEEGHTVLYFDMHTVLTVQVLAEKVLKGANIPRKRVTIERVYQWARDMSGHTLLIFDNCDDIIRENKDQFQRVVQDLLQSSHFMKVILTSRFKATFLDDSYEFSLKEFTTEASSKLLSAIVVSNLVSEDQRQKLADITGNVPLALRIVGSLLNTPDPPSANKVISELKNELIETLSREELPSHHRIQASFNLSYKYLSQSEKHCAQMLAFFPGPFSLNAADFILTSCVRHKALIKDCLRGLFQRSLLQFDHRSEQYCYHTLLRTFFSYKLRLETKWHAAESNALFRANFQEYYARVLHELSENFKEDFVQALKSFDLEKHNIELFQQHTLLSVNDCKVLSSIEAVALALDVGLLQCRFSLTQLIKLTSTVTVKLEVYRLEKLMPDCDDKWLFIHYAHFVVFWARFEFKSQNYSTAINVLSKRTSTIEWLWNRADEPENQSLCIHYINFYTILSETYEVFGRHEDVIMCQERIMDKTAILKKCLPGTCDYNYIGTTYYNAGNYEMGVHFYELALKHSSMNPGQRVKCLLNLYSAYIMLWQRNNANIILETIVSNIPQILDDMECTAMAQQIRLVRFFGNIPDPIHAAVVMDKLLNCLASTHVVDHHIVHEAINVIVLLCENYNYSKAVEIGTVTLHYRYTTFQDSDVHQYKAMVYALLAWAEFQQGNLSVSLKYLDQSFELGTNADHVSICKYTIFLCMQLMWIKPRCITEVYFCAMNNVELSFYETDQKSKQATFLDSIPPLSVTNDLTVSNDGSFPIEVSNFIIDIYDIFSISEKIKASARSFNILMMFFAPVWYFVIAMCIAILIGVLFLLPYFALCGHVMYCLCFTCHYKSVFYITYIILVILDILLFVWFGFHRVSFSLFLVMGGFLMCILFRLLVLRRWFYTQSERELF